MSTSSPVHVQLAELTRVITALTAAVNKLDDSVSVLIGTQDSILKSVDAITEQVGPTVTALSNSPMLKMLTGGK